MTVRPRCSGSRKAFRYSGAEGSRRMRWDGPRRNPKICSSLRRSGSPCTQSDMSDCPRRHGVDITTVMTKTCRARSPDARFRPMGASLSGRGDFTGPFHRAIPLSCGFSDDWGCGSKSSDSSLLSILNALILCEKEPFYHYRRYRCRMGHSYASKCCRYGKRIV